MVRVNTSDHTRPRWLFCGDIGHQVVTSELLNQGVVSVTLAGMKAARKPPPNKEDEDGSIGTSIRLPKELRARLGQIAAEERRTFGNVVRILLEDALAARDKKKA